MKISILLALLSTAVVFSSCSKDYFETEVGSYLSGNRKAEMESVSSSKARIIRGEIGGLYSVLYQFNLNGNTAHDYFGLKSIHLATDLTGEDMVQEARSHFIFDYEMDNRGADYRRTYLMWSLFYKMISSSNEMLEKYLSADTLSEDLAAIKAEVLTVRGIAYYYLINLYQKTYKGNENKPGVPIILSTKETNLPRASVDSVYQQIISDLTYGVEYGSYTSTTTEDADKKVAAAYLAKTYAAMEDWAKVETYAKIAIDGISVALPSNMVRFDNADVLWAKNMTSETSTVYASFYSHIDNTIDGYAGGVGAYKSIHNKLYDQISPNDARRNWFIGDTLGTLPMYANVKYISQTIDFSDDYIYLRSADPYLLYVEAVAEQGRQVEAAGLLKNFLTTRGVGSEVDQQSDLLSYIRVQRRIELWGEGSTFFDFKRWNMGVTRTQAGSNHKTKVDAPAGDNVFVYQIPTREIERNSLLVQND